MTFLRKLLSSGLGTGIDGRCVRLHLDGACTYEGSGSGLRPARTAFCTIESYVRVFFDGLGWPWPKHPCTDTFGGQRLSVSTLPLKRYPTAFRNKSGAVMEIFTLAELSEERAGGSCYGSKTSIATPS